MKELSRKQKARRRSWLLARCEELRQKCNHMTARQLHKALDDGLRIIYCGMKKKPVSIKSKKKIDWDAVCERTRQRCNKLTDEERHRFRAEALRIIYSADAEAPTRGR